MQFLNSALISLALIFATINVGHAQSVDAPVLTAGLSWQYQTNDMWSNQVISFLTSKVLGTSGEFVRLSRETTNMGPLNGGVKTTTSESTIRADLNSTAMYRGKKMDRIVYKWPLVPGEKWTYQILTDLPPTANNSATSTMTGNYNVEVTGWETVEVPAGKFKAIKIVNRGTWIVDAAGISGSGVSTVWYSPDVKSDVKSMYEAYGADGSPQTRTMTQLMKFSR